MKVSLEKRLEVCKKHGLCFRCLCKGHLAAKCTSVCSGCKGKHHILLCRKACKSSSGSSGNGAKKGSGKVERPVSTIALPSENSVDESLFQTEFLEVCGGKGPVESHFPFDTGSIRSYLSGCLDRCCDTSFRRSENSSCELFDSGIAFKSKRRNLPNLKLLGLLLSLCARKVFYNPSLKGRFNAGLQCSSPFVLEADF